MQGIFSAINKKNPVLLRQLIANGANIESPNPKGIRPLHRACEIEFTEGIKILIEAGVNVNSTSTKMLYNKNNTLRLKRRPGNTYYAIHKVCYKQYTAGLRLLIKAGANCNVRDSSAMDDYQYSHGLTPLHIVCKDKWATGVNLLVKVKDINLNIKTLSNEQSPLHTCSYYRNTYALKVLLKAGANINIKNSVDYTPLHLACKKSIECSGCREIPNNKIPWIEGIKILVKAGADVNAKSKKYYFPYSASNEGHESARTPIGVLLDDYALKTQRTNSSYSINNQYKLNKVMKEIIVMLVTSGAKISKNQVNYPLFKNMKNNMKKYINNRSNNSNNNNGIYPIHVRK